jgi:aldehyde dehydrogenase (NAD+)
MGAKMNRIFLCLLFCGAAAWAEHYEASVFGALEWRFVKPTVFVNVKNDMTIAREEIFGPVLSVIAYEDEEDAVRIANDTEFGLHAYVSGTDIARARRVASRLLAGRVAINGMLDDQQAPFGGFKNSGVGREFGTFGIEAFLEPRAILEAT